MAGHAGDAGEFPLQPNDTTGFGARMEPLSSNQIETALPGIFPPPKQSDLSHPDTLVFCSIGLLCSDAVTKAGRVVWLIMQDLSCDVKPCGSLRCIGVRSPRHLKVTQTQKVEPGSTSGPAKNLQLRSSM